MEIWGNRVHGCKDLYDVLFLSLPWVDQRLRLRLPVAVDEGDMKQYILLFYCGSYITVYIHSAFFFLFVSHLLSRVDLGRPVPWFSIWSIKDLFLIGQWIIYKDETFGVKQLLIKIAAGQTKGQQFLYLSYVFTFYCFLHIVLVSTPIMSSLHVTLVSHVQICMEHLKYPHQLCYGWLLSFFWQQHETYNL